MELLVQEYGFVLAIVIWARDAFDHEGQVDHRFIRVSQVCLVHYSQVIHVQESLVRRVFVDLLFDGYRAFLFVDLVQFSELRLMDLRPSFDWTFIGAVVSLLVAVVHRFKDRLRLLLNDVVVHLPPHRVRHHRVIVALHLAVHFHANYGLKVG